MTSLQSNNYYYSRFRGIELLQGDKDICGGEQGKGVMEPVLLRLNGQVRRYGNFPGVAWGRRSKYNVHKYIVDYTDSCLKKNLNASRPSEHPTQGGKCQNAVVVVVVVVDSHMQRIVVATEKTTVPQQVSHGSIKCQSRCLWSQRGTKVNGSHHGDNPLLRPTGIQIATKRYATLHAMAPTNIKTVHQTS